MKLFKVEDLDTMNNGTAEIPEEIMEMFFDNDPSVLHTGNCYPKSYLLELQKQSKEKDS